MILDCFSLKNKVAIVTGASSGIGQGITCALSEAGADLVLVGRRIDLLQKVSDSLTIKHQKNICISADVSLKEQGIHVVDETVRKFNKIDILVNAAGINRRDLIEDFSEKDWDDVLNVNLKGTFLISQAVGKVMLKQKKGKIINIASLKSVVGGLHTPSYTASKGGVVQLTKAFAAEWAKYNINVNAIAPGWFKTSMTQSFYEDKNANTEILAHIPMKRWGEPKDIAGTAIFLASEASNYITGITIFVDGGYLTW